MKKLSFVYDYILGRLVVDQVRSYGVDVSLVELQTRVTAAEENISIITEGGTPVQGTYSFGDWSHDNIVEFAAWTA